MCDTQIIRQNGAVFFAKNSDREASEPQIIMRVAPVSGDKSPTVQTTYLQISQVPDRFGVILSKPDWIWGAEMGVNDQGVVIGNEAVFTKLVKKAGEALLGMDLLRLALERGKTASSALDVITELLERHGQGGPAGFRDKSFRYDNSFIIADANEAWILETAGQWWAAKKVESFGAISNRLSIGCDYDLASSGLEDFAKKEGYLTGRGEFDFAKAFDTRFMAFMGKAHGRQSLSLRCLNHQATTNSASLAALAANLRSHQTDDDNFARHGNGDVCMHAGGLTRPSQTCGSMIVKLKSGQLPEVMATGTSAPCLSLFKPVDFDFSHTLFWEQEAAHSAEENLWRQFEWVHRRALLDKTFRDELRVSRDKLENQLMSVFDDEMSMTYANDLSRIWHEQWQESARRKPPHYAMFKPYDRYWKKLNQIDKFVWK